LLCTDPPPLIRSNPKPFCPSTGFCKEAPEKTAPTTEQLINPNDASKEIMEGREKK